jgi:hypothetical protein
VNPLYVDLDHCLSYPVYKGRKQEGEVDHFVFRPWAREFLEVLSTHGKPVLLTASEGGWAEAVLSERPDLRRLFDRVITMEDLQPVADQLNQIFNLQGLTDREQRAMVPMVQRIAEPGVIFDDQAYGSSAWYLKSVAVGTHDQGPAWWIRVERFARESPDRFGLERALYRYLTRSRNRVELSGIPG